MSPLEALCAECGAALAAGQDRCWLCHRALSPRAADNSYLPRAANNPYAASRPAGEISPAQFSLESLFLVTTLVAVGLGVFLLAPGIGVLLALVAVPALARTLLAGFRKRQAGVRLSAGQKIGAFLLSFFLILGIGYAGLIAFFAVCLGTGLAALAVGGDGEWVLLAALAAASIVAIPLVGWLLWISRPQKT